MATLAERVRREVQEILSSSMIRAEVSIQGSVARDTWLRGEADLDVFAILPVEIDRNQWINKLLPVLRKGLAHYPIIERFSEHPFLEFSDNNIKVNVVPCYAVEKGNWKSATDRTPYHTMYMKEHLTPDLRIQARLLKKFLKGVRVYGAEIRVGGFSGMLAETLAICYGSFNRTLEEGSKWQNQILLEAEPSSPPGGRPRRFDTSLVVIDPVDPNRNLAASVREEKLWEFVAASRSFLTKPALSYFYPRSRTLVTKSNLLKRLDNPPHDIVVATFSHKRIVLDILWGQLFSLERSLVDLAQRHEFRVLRSTAWSDGDRTSAVLVEVETATLPLSRLHSGPPLSKREESDAFLKRHTGSRETLSGPWIAGDRWVVERKRDFPKLSDLIASSVREPKLGAAFPAQMRENLRRGLRVFVNEKALKLYDKPGFASSLLEFLDGRPSWMTKLS